MYPRENYKTKKKKKYNNYLYKLLLARTSHWLVRRSGFDPTASARVKVRHTAQTDDDDATPPARNYRRLVAGDKNLREAVLRAHNAAVLYIHKYACILYIIYIYYTSSHIILRVLYIYVVSTVCNNIRRHTRYNNIMRRRPYAPARARMRRGCQLKLFFFYFFYLKWRTVIV